MKNFGWGLNNLNSAGTDTSTILDPSENWDNDVQYLIKYSLTRYEEVNTNLSEFSISFNNFKFSSFSGFGCLEKIMITGITTEIIAKQNYYEIIILIF